MRGLGDRRKDLGEFLDGLKKSIDKNMDDFCKVPHSVNEYLLNRQTIATEIMASIYTEDVQIQEEIAKAQERQAAALERIAAVVEKVYGRGKETVVVEAPRFDPNDRDEVYI
jgi:hypothetical protein